MGLMYLKASHFVYGRQEPEKFNTILKALGLEGYATEAPFMRVEVTIGYWRKANAIHNWFMKLVKKDDCTPVSVSREKLTELKTLCERVLADHALAPELLPTKSGFFFGSTAYEQWYFKDVQSTFDLLTSILANEAFRDVDFIYRASW